MKIPKSKNKSSSLGPLVFGANQNDQ